MCEPDNETLISECLSNESTRQVDAIQRLLDRHVYTSVPTLVATLESPDPLVRSAAAHALGTLGAENAGPAGSALMNLLNDSEVIVRSEVVDALGVLRFAPAVEPIRRMLLNDSDPLVRASAAETLGDLDDARALPELALALGDTDEAVRAYAANSIGLLGAPQLLPQLQSYILLEHSPNVKAELHAARYRLGAREDLHALLNLLDTADEALAPNILNILEDITRRNLPPNLPADAARIRASVTGLEQRIPNLGADAERIVARLRG